MPPSKPPANWGARHRSIGQRCGRWRTRPGKRKGAALALATASPEVAIEALVSANRDAHLDVRKAAVGSLSRWARDPDVSVASKAALDDSDANVRAIARHALRAG